jgi:hypothetical protein
VIDGFGFELFADLFELSEVNRVVRTVLRRPKIIHISYAKKRDLLEGGLQCGSGGLFHFAHVLEDELEDGLEALHIVLHGKDALQVEGTLKLAEERLALRRYVVRVIILVRLRHCLIAK